MNRDQFRNLWWQSYGLRCWIFWILLPWAIVGGIAWLIFKG